MYILPQFLFYFFMFKKRKKKSQDTKPSSAQGPIPNPSPRLGSGRAWRPWGRRPPRDQCLIDSFHGKNKAQADFLPVNLNFTCPQASGTDDANRFRSQRALGRPRGGLGKRDLGRSHDDKIPADARVPLPVQELSHCPRAPQQLLSLRRARSRRPRSANPGQSLPLDRMGTRGTGRARL